MHSLFIAPKDKLSQVFWLNCFRHFDEKEAIEHLTHIRPLKTWMMSGNAMSIDDCIKRCESWKKRFDISYIVSKERDCIEISMRYVTFKYDWNNRVATVIVKTDAAKAIGWSDTTFTLKGKHCCDIEKVFTVNERLGNAIDLPDLIEWCKANDVYDKKKEDFSKLLEQLEWWSHTLQKFCKFDVRIASPKQLSKRLPLDDELIVKSWIFGETIEPFRFNRNDTRLLDQLYASTFTPEIKKSLQFIESCIEYLTSVDIHDIGKQWQTNQKITKYVPQNISIYEGYGRKKNRTGITAQILPTYSAIYDAAINLGSESHHRSLGHFQMDLPEKGSDKMNFYFHAGYRYSLHDAMASLTCTVSELPEKFPPFLKKFLEMALVKAKEVRAEHKRILRLIDDKLSQS